jgi:DNA-binding PadR family transcriptional regulator
MDERISSYQKGINRLFEHQDRFERVIIEYILSVNSKYGSNMFPTPQIAKIMLDKLQFKKTQFPIIHKIVRTILENWEKQGWVEYVTTTKSGRNRRTKFIYRFSPENLEVLKGRFIGSSITAIEQDMDIPTDKDMLRSREEILRRWTDQIHDIVTGLESEDVEEDDDLDPDDIEDSDEDEDDLPE